MAMRKQDYQYITELLEIAKDCAERDKSTNTVESLESALKFLEVQQTTKPPYPYPFTEKGASNTSAS